ncbi:MAG: C-terminal helicase domain-containing protein, partial [Janthinobacterium lividum]
LDGSEESILVMAHHSDVIAGIVSGLVAVGHEAAVITGSTSDEDRQRAQDDIQGCRKRVFVGSMRACGVAITLTAASTVVFAEQDWTPGIMSQAEDRAHRIGQEGSVLVQHLVVDGSFDATMAKAVSAKGNVIAAALDAEEDEDALLVQEASDAEAADEVEARIAEVVVAEVTTSFERAAAREDARAAEVGLSDGEELSSERQAAVLACLRMVAGDDGDRANEANGVGFSGADTIAGHRLAERQTLSRREAILALHLVRRYRGQLPADMLNLALGGDPVVEEAAVSASVTAPLDATPAQGRRPVGRPRLAEETLSGAERTKRWRDRHGIAGMSIPGELAERLRGLRDARGGTVSDALSAALDALRAT